MVGKSRRESAAAMRRAGLEEWVRRGGDGGVGFGDVVGGCGSRCGYGYGYGLGVH